MSAPAKYGTRNVPKMIRQVEVLRQAIAAEGTPAIQDAWDAVEEHIDYAYRADATAALAQIEREAEARGRVKGMREAAEIANECGKEVDAQDGSYIRHHPLRGFVFKDAILARAAEIEKDAK